MDPREAFIQKIVQGGMKAVEQHARCSQLADYLTMLTMTMFGG